MRQDIHESTEWVTNEEATVELLGEREIHGTDVCNNALNLQGYLLTYIDCAQVDNFAA